MKLPGPYVPLDVHYARDADIRRAGPNAELLYIRGLAYAKAHYTDGFIPDFDLPAIAVGLPMVDRSVGALLREELWLSMEGGWQIRGWRLWNETSDQTREKRKRAAERQAAKRDRDKAAGHATVTAMSRVTHA